MRGADYVIKRGFFALVTIFVAITISFFLFRALPGNAITDLSRIPHAASIAMALACQPRILLADEPTTALDVMVQAQILDLLTHLSSELGLTLVLVTHDLPVVAQTCGRAAVMYAGEIAECGPMEELFHQPRHPYTRLLFAATSDLYGDEDVTSIGGAPPRLDRPVTGCPFQPRCDVVMDRCAQEHPALRPVGTGHEAACHHTEDHRAERVSST